MLKTLQTIQIKTLKIIIEDFKTTFLSILNIEAYVLSIKQRFEKHICNIMLRITITFTYEKIIEKKFKRRNKRMSSLKILTARYEKISNMKIKNLKKVMSYVIFS